MHYLRPTIFEVKGETVVDPFALFPDLTGRYVNDLGPLLIFDLLEWTWILMRSDAVSRLLSNRRWDNGGIYVKFNLLCRHSIQLFHQRTTLKQYIENCLSVIWSNYITFGSVANPQICSWWGRESFTCDSNVEFLQMRNQTDEVDSLPTLIHESVNSAFSSTWDEQNDLPLYE